MTDKTGTVVVYLDELHRPHYALITNDFNKQSIGPVNLIYVNPEASMEDDYGRQMKRATSVGFWGDGYTELLAIAGCYLVTIPTSKLEYMERNQNMQSMAM